ncbi:MAG: hypothetical protein BWX87_01461 [Bacteroidetes bacterium ADurb.Bin123]|jgi:hypothetical protein|nr:MAG: hypothetical protein BWX87_01461 [Bacteroidetes bacterium ADurb.Bin123]
MCLITNCGERIDYIRPLCQVSINAWSLLIADSVMKPVKLIPVWRDEFPRPICSGEESGSPGYHRH